MIYLTCQADIPSAGAKDIGVLFQQACRLVSPNGGLLHRACVLILFYDALDEPLGGVAPEGVFGDGGGDVGSRLLPGMQCNSLVYDMRLELLLRF